MMAAWIDSGYCLNGRCWRYGCFNAALICLLLKNSTMPHSVQVMKHSRKRLKAMAIAGECMGDLKNARCAAFGW